MTFNSLDQRLEWLPRMESNHDSQIQNLKSYRLDDRAIFTVIKLYPPLDVLSIEIMYAVKTGMI